MATSASYLEEVAGGMVAAAAFEDDDAAVSAIKVLRDSGVREQDISVIAKDRRRALLVAGDRAWVPGKGWGGLLSRLVRLLNGGIPRDVTRRYRKALRSGQIVIVVAAGGQPPDTISGLPAQARGGRPDGWGPARAKAFRPAALARASL